MATTGQFSPCGETEPTGVFGTFTPCRDQPEKGSKQTITGRQLTKLFSQEFSERIGIFRGAQIEDAQSRQ